MNRAVRLEGELYVYECRGQGYPLNEPSMEGFLGIWPEPPFYYVFCGAEARDGIQRWIKEQEGWFLRSVYELDYDQWQQVSNVQQRVGPFVIGTASSGPSETASVAGVHIHIDPGVVFGSGLHPTTRGCLAAIAYLLERHPVRTAVDLGTGTGILAIACASLGVSRVMALDCNPLAIQVARRNIQSNNQGEAVRLIVAEGLEVLSTPDDLLVMNLEWPCLRAVLGGLEWTNYRWVIVSGFLKAQYNQLQSILPRNAIILQREDLDDWVTLVIATDFSSSNTP